MTALNKKSDLTRWNRSGLARFRYIDGNAAMYLECLRLAAKEEFTGSGGANAWSDLDTKIPVPSTESDVEQMTRWLTQYWDGRRDHAWEIFRTLARSSHVLGETIDTYANEHFINTTTEWENLRRLVEMLDYHPAPPASAQTPIALTVKDEKSGILDAGFAFKNKPDDGSKPAVFETLQELDVDARLNTLRPLDWNVSQLPFQFDAASGTAVFPLEQTLENISVGTKGILIVALSGGVPLAFAVTVGAINDTQLVLNAEVAPALPSETKRHHITLLLQPEFQRTPQISGSDVMLLDADHGLSVGAAVAWLDSYIWHAAFVREVEGRRIRLSRSAPVVATEIYASAFSDRNTYDVDGIATERIVLPTHLNGERIYNADWDENLNAIGGHSHAYGGDTALYDFIDGTAYNRIYYVPDTDPVATVLVANPPGISFDGKVKNIASGDYVLVETTSNTLTACRIVSLQQDTEAFSMSILPAVSNIKNVYGQFSTEARPLDYDKNEQPIFLTTAAFRSDKNSTITLPPDAFTDLLARGRKLIVSGLGTAMVVTVKSVDDINGRIVVEPAIPGSEPLSSGTTDIYTRYATHIYGNVVDSGHGETQSEKVLGSGDATQSNQSFVFDKTEVSFIGDGSFPPGVRADVRVSVDGRVWQQVSSFNNSAPEDHHYTVRLTEDDTLVFSFGGDGRGRRLPSGNNNIRIRYRKGTGLSGNLAHYSLEKEVKPHFLIDKLVQPIAATGGNDREQAESLRENAPKSALTLERAVSLSDFVHLAQNNSRVWQAAAIRQAPGIGRTKKIAMAIVPAGGGELGTLAEDISGFLIANALPDVAIDVIAYQAVIIDVNVIIRVDEQAFDPEFVAEDVKDVLFYVFNLQRARMGAPYYRSQLFAAVESVTGVENCQCDISGSGFKDEQGLEVSPKNISIGSAGAVKRLMPFWFQVIYIKEGISNISITTLPMEN